jgi:hypothetical protein
MLEQCAGGKVRDCRVIEALSDHSQRAADSHLPGQPCSEARVASEP